MNGIHIKNGLLSLFIFCSMMTAGAQQSLTFKGQDAMGNYVQLHHVVIEDVSQGWTDTLFYPDTILFLSEVGVPNYDQEEVFSVSQNVPNPFDGVTDFTMTLPSADHVVIGVFDMMGRKVTSKSLRLPAGAHVFRVWLNVPQQYLLTVRTSRESTSIKMVNYGVAQGNHIAYSGEYPLSFPLKIRGGGGYESGDLLHITGFRVVDGHFLPSETVEITTIPEESVILTFAVLGVISDVRHFTDTNTLFVTYGAECEGGCIGTMNLHVSGYAPGTVLQSMEELPYIRLKMEHSYLGDLWIQVACPNEQTATILKKYPTTNSSQCSSLIPANGWGWPNSAGPIESHLGMFYYIDGSPACDPSANPMGECWNYCWSNDTSHAQTYACGTAHVWEACNHFYSYNPSINGSTDNFVAATNMTTMSNVYHPDQSFTSLIGCPLNGLWQIRIIDVWTYDNGYVEEAEIALHVPITCPVDSPYVATGALTSITRTSAFCSGEVLSDGLAPVTERGFCWDTLPEPTVTSEYVAVGTGIGSFSALITGLMAETTYYCRAYATNTYGTVYGETVIFTTDANIFPTVTTGVVTAVTDSSAVVDGAIMDDGGLPVLERGICWAVNSEPTLADNYIIAPTDTDSFSCALTNLLSATHYYARAYATNAVGTGYGAVVDITTEYGLPSVSLDSITMIGSSYATCHGTLLSDGGDPAATVGLCWALSPNPTAADNHVEWGGEVGAFNRTIGGIHDAVCYVRPYATNIAGTVYGNTLMFTPDTIPTSMQVALVHLDHDYATMRVTIVCDSTAMITNRGLCMDTLPQPDTSDVDFSATGTANTFDIHVGNLERASTYYLRGHCLSNGTLLYSDDLVLLTVAEDGQPCIGTPTLTDYEGHVYNTVQVGSQCWMRSNLYTTHFFDGTAIPSGSVGAGSYSEYEPYYYHLTYNTSQIPTYGYAYNWKALTKNSTTTNVNAQGICPDGWHIPDDAEWVILRNYTGNNYGCGDDTTSVAKALADVSGWNNSTANCSPGAYPGNNNLTGFSAFPSGGHYQNTFQSGEAAYFWSRSLNPGVYSACRAFKISYNQQVLSQTFNPYQWAYPVRCVRDC